MRFCSGVMVCLLLCCGIGLGSVCGWFVIGLVRSCCIMVGLVVCWCLVWS